MSGGGKEHALAEVGNRVAQPAGLVWVRIVQGEGGGGVFKRVFHGVVFFSSTRPRASIGHLGREDGRMGKG